MERIVPAWRLIDEADTTAPVERPAPAGHGARDTSRPGPPTAFSGISIGLVVLALVGLLGGGLLLVATAPRPSIVLPGEAGGPVAGGPDSPGATVPAGAVDPNGSSILVDVAGAVRAPGVYRLPAGARVADAIAAAGGFGPAVDAAAVARTLNLAAPVADGDKVVVPQRGAAATLGDPATGGSGGASGPAATAGPIDLNRATQAELESLPGIGPKTAEKIMAARAEAPFRSVDELLERGIVGSATFAKIRDLVVVR